MKGSVCKSVCWGFRELSMTWLGRLFAAFVVNSVIVQFWNESSCDLSVALCSRVVISHIHGELWAFRELSMILLGWLCARLVVSSAMA